MPKKGFKHSEETKQKMSKAKQNMSEETKIKMGISQRKRKQASLETKQKMSKAKQNMSEETKQKMSKANLGNKCYFWKGGISTLTKRRIARQSWKNISKMIRERDNYCCQKCGSIGTKEMLEVHHKTPYYLTQNDSLENLITLCSSCHRKTEHEFNKSISFLKHLSDFARTSIIPCVPSFLSQ